MGADSAEDLSVLRVGGFVSVFELAPGAMPGTFWQMIWPHFINSKSVIALRCEPRAALQTRR